MDITSKKCDVCGRIEHGGKLPSWLALCKFLDGVYLTGALKNISEYVAQNTYYMGKRSHLSIVECCSQNCLMKAVAVHFSDAGDAPMQQPMRSILRVVGRD